MAKIKDFRQERPYHDDSTASRLLSEVKHHRAWLVLRWGTTLESQVLFFYYNPHATGASIFCQFSNLFCNVTQVLKLTVKKVMSSHDRRMFFCQF